MDHLKHSAAAAWVKRYYLASRAVMEATLRPHDLGSTQWYVLWQLANNGPTVQRDFVTLLHVEKPTLSEVVSALVRKGFIEQTPAADRSAPKAAHDHPCRATAVAGIARSDRPHPEGFLRRG